MRLGRNPTMIWRARFQVDPRVKHLVKLQWILHFDLSQKAEKRCRHILFHSLLIFLGCSNSDLKFRMFWIIDITRFSSPFGISSTILCPISLVIMIHTPTVSKISSFPLQQENCVDTICKSDHLEECTYDIWSPLTD